MWKNSEMRRLGLWKGKIWQILASMMAHEIPPRKPMALELIPRFLAQTLISLRASLKFSVWFFPASSRIMRLFLRPRREVLLFSSRMEEMSSRLMTRSISLGTVSVERLQKLISILIYLQLKVMMGTLAVLRTESPVTSASALILSDSPSKKCVSRLMKCGTTHTKSISLLFDRSSSTQLPNVSTLAVQFGSQSLLILRSFLAMRILHSSTMFFTNLSASSFSFF